MAFLGVLCLLQYLAARLTSMKRGGLDRFDESVFVGTANPGAIQGAAALHLLLRCRT